MFIVFRFKRLIVVSFLLLVIICFLLVCFQNEDKLLFMWDNIPVNNEVNEAFTPVIERTLSIRNNAMLENNLEAIKPLYNTSTKLGVWAYEHELKKIKYLHNWADKQGVHFKEIYTVFKIRWVKEQKHKVTINFSAITDYSYEYDNLPDSINRMRIASYHIVDLVGGSDDWEISKEWYTDPFADSLNLDNLKTEDNNLFITSQSPRDFTNLNERRADAVEYADHYCGASDHDEYFFQYNKAYKNYNGLGGDCANFASQVLHEGGKFRKTGSWSYEKDGSRAWVNAQALKDYLIYSGRGSLIVHGTYDKVLKLSYKLLPGDIVAYEKKGKVVHVSVVTGADSRGYSLVNCHNTDRFKVPWDLGWSDKGIKFWFIRVNY